MTTAQPGNVEQGILERAQRIHVEVVRRLVEQQQVAAAAQQLREVHAVALAARQVADPRLLRGPLEVEAGRCTGGELIVSVANLQLVEPFGDLLPDRLFRVERVTRLVDVGELDGVAEPAFPSPASPRR